MSTSERSVKDVISRLVEHMDKLLALLANAEGSLDLAKIIGNIKDKLKSLRTEFEQEEEREGEVGKGFDGVLKRVEKILGDAAALESAQNEITEIEAEIMRIIEQGKKIAKEVVSPADAREDGKVAGTRPGASEKEPPQQRREPSEAEKKIQQSDAMSHLRRVIENLDTKLKRCLFCLTIFPEDAVIKKRLLIHWWMGERIVQSADDGKKCFEELSSRGLIITEKPPKHCPTVHSCKVHPWIRKLLISIATSNAFLEFDSDDNPIKDYSRTHRAFLLQGRTLAARSDQEMDKGKEPGESEDEEDKEEEGKVKTLYNIDAKYVDIESSWFSDKKELLTVQLGRWQSSEDHHIEISRRNSLEDLGACKKLRYLSLRGMSRVESLPDSISNLGDLVVLDLRACHNLEKLTSKVSSLANLEYLDVSECYLLDQLPKGLKNLTKLQVFKGFVIAHATAKGDPCRLGELATLDKLRKLSISVGQESDDSELQSLTKDSIEFKAPLTSLTITWGVVKGSKKKTRHFLGRTEMSKMTPPPAANLKKLEKLDIRAFPEKHFPEWISPVKLPELKKLYIRGDESAAHKVP